MFGRHVVLTNVNSYICCSIWLMKLKKKIHISCLSCPSSHFFSAELVHQSFWQHLLWFMIEKNSVTLVLANFKVCQITISSVLQNVTSVTSRLSQNDLARTLRAKCRNFKNLMLPGNFHQSDIPYHKNNSDLLCERDRFPQ